MGYNAFALIYRPGGPYADLARAIACIYDHADELQVDPEGYSLWSGSSWTICPTDSGRRAAGRPLMTRSWRGFSRPMDDRAALDAAAGRGRAPVPGQASPQKQRGGHVPSTWPPRCFVPR